MMLFIWPNARIEEQTITAAELITQDIDINEPIGNLKKLLEPRIQVPLDGYDICLQDILVCVSVWTDSYLSALIVLTLICFVISPRSCILITACSIKEWRQMAQYSSVCRSSRNRVTVYSDVAVGQISTCQHALRTEIQIFGWFYMSCGGTCCFKQHFANSFVTMHAAFMSLW